MSARLTESYIQDAFHSYLKSSLTQAKAERLIDTELLSSAESDLVVIGPALVLYFAALRCTTNPPSVPLPRTSKQGGAPVDLSADNCPPQFAQFLSVWANTVPTIQALSPEHQHDLARTICGLSPITEPREPSLNGIAADLRAVAIEISQRRSFQDRYASDLQAAIDAGGSNDLHVKASFVPPPMYEPSSPSSAGPSPQFTSMNLPPISPRRGFMSMPEPELLSPPPLPRRSHSRSASQASSRSTDSAYSSASSSSMFDAAPAIDLIRETLYAAVGDALAEHPSLRTLLARDPTRAYFASVAYAILAVSTTSITPSGSVRGVLGQELTLEECPPPLKPFMMEFAAIGRQAMEMREEDDTAAIQAVSTGKDIPEPRMDRVQTLLEHGIGYQHDQDRRRSVEGRAVAFANRINALALGMTRLRGFRERQRDVFKVLAGVS